MKKLSKTLLTLVLALPMFLTSCNNGGAESSNPDEPGHVHNFDKKVTSSQYLVSEATCHEKAKYYYSCECGEHGAATYESGDYADHTYEDHYSYNKFQHWKASTCGHGVEKERADHVFDQQIANEEFKVEGAGSDKLYYFSCICGYHSTSMFELNHDVDEEHWCFDDTGHWHECLGCGIKEDFSEHDYEFVRYEDPNQYYENDAAINTVYKCSVCGHEKIEETHPDREYSNFQWKQVPTEANAPVYFTCDFDIENVPTKHFEFGPLYLNNNDFDIEITYPECSSGGMINYVHPNHNKIVQLVYAIADEYDIPKQAALYIAPKATANLPAIQISTPSASHAVFAEYVPSTTGSCSEAAIKSHYKCSCCGKLFTNSFCSEEVDLSKLKSSDSFFRAKKWFYVDDSSANSGLYIYTCLERGTLKKSNSYYLTTNVGTKISVTATKLYNTASSFYNYFNGLFFNSVPSQIIQNEITDQVDSAYGDFVLFIHTFNKVYATNHCLVNACLHSDSSLSTCYKYTNWETGHCNHCGTDHATPIDIEYDEMYINFKAYDSSWKMNNVEWFVVSDELPLEANKDYRVNILQNSFTEPYTVYSCQYEPGTKNLSKKTLGRFRDGGSLVANVDYEADESKTYFCVENTMTTASSTYFAVCKNIYQDTELEVDSNYSDFDYDYLTDSWGYFNGYKDYPLYLTSPRIDDPDYVNYLPFIVYNDQENVGSEISIVVSALPEDGGNVLFEFDTDEMIGSGRCYYDEQGDMYVIELEPMFYANNNGRFFVYEQISANSASYTNYWCYCRDYLYVDITITFN